MALLTLIERAERKGQATRRVGAGLEQWGVKYETNGFTHEKVEVFHYGTRIFNAEKISNNWHLISWYGESKSDSEALNGLCNYYDIDESFRYRPSLGQFERVGESNS